MDRFLSKSVYEDFGPQSLFAPHDKRANISTTTNAYFFIPSGHNISASGTDQRKRLSGVTGTLSPERLDDK